MTSVSIRSRRWLISSATTCLVATLLSIIMWPPLTQAQDAPCPRLDGWTRLVAQREDRPSDESAPPWEAQPPRNNGNPRQWLYAIAGGWEGPGVIYVGGEPGLFRSRDCGATWERTQGSNFAGATEPVSWILTRALAPGGRIYAGTLGTVQVSDDSGFSWHQSDRPGHPNGLGVSPANSDLVYIFGWYNGWTSGSHNAMDTVRWTADGGQTWKTIRGPRPGQGTLPRGSKVVDPTDPTIVYAIGGGVVYRSTDGANSFDPYSFYSLNANDLGHTTINSDGSHFWYLSDAGLYLSTDRGLTWRVPATAPLVHVASISASPKDPRVLFALARGDEIWAYREPAVAPECATEPCSTDGR
jgi:photosystem II stability/assembly factor-like uncharacterized protein